MCKDFTTFPAKGLHMIRDTNTDQLVLFSPEDFQMPFGSGLDPGNRWVRWAQQMPWDELAAVYHESLACGGRPAKPARLVIGALIIKHRLGLSDAETIEQLRENPYLQFFIGLERYQHEPVFAPTLFVKLRERLTPERFAAFEQIVIDRQAAIERAPARTGRTSPEPNTPDDDGDGPPPSQAGTDAPPTDGGSPDDPQGTLIVDASVAEQKIRYPNDVGLVNEARESAESLLDRLWEQLKEYDLATGRKPRSYRRRARRDYLHFSKQRRPGARKRRAARRQQLQYLRRDLDHIDALLDRWEGACPGAGFPLPRRAQYRLWIIREVYRQQATMHRQSARRIEDRIVSLHQPHVRPIVRGRLGHPVEFGSKFSVALTGGIACVDRLRWDAFGEAGDLITQCQAYHERYGRYPAKVLADGVYGTRANRRWLKERGIAFGGKPLGRPPKRTAAQWRAIQRERSADARARIPIEGKFGQGKGAYGLDRIPARRADTSEAWVRAIFLVMNLIKLGRVLFWLRMVGFYQAIIHAIAGSSSDGAGSWRLGSHPVSKSDITPKSPGFG